MGWNWMQARIVPEDAMIRPLIGPGNLSREEAHREIQGFLDAGGTPLATVATAWKRGAEEDTVYAGLFIWSIYEHDDGDDPRRAAVEWLEDFAQTMRSTGLDVQVAAFDDPPAGDGVSG